ncbi:hypothetical protein MTYM_01421 [Methylococcales bacterium]|nr:hypothetical protein MTYM_01421 [Methylococcales bacterium]
MVVYRVSALQPLLLSFQKKGLNYENYNEAFGPVINHTSLSRTNTFSEVYPLAQQDKGIDPFASDSDEWTLIVVISDIHLGADLKYAECSKNLPAL